MSAAHLHHIDGPTQNSAEPLSSLEEARAKLDAIRAALPEVDWEADRQVSAWLDEQFRAMGRRKLQLRPKKKEEV
jgi:hypothetical protein